MAWSAPQVSFTALYVAEVVIKVVGLGHAALWADQQNVLAALCTTASLIDTGLFVLGGGGGCVGGGGGADALLRLFRALRLLRLLRLANRIPGLELLAAAAAAALPLILRISVVVVMELLVFAQVGVALFHAVDFGLDGANPSAHFGTTYNGMQLLWLTATGENWVDFMTTAGGAKGTSRYAASICFFSFFLLSMQFLMLNLFTMVITEAFEVLRDETRAQIAAECLTFVHVWAQYDPTASGVIRRPQLIALISALPPPLGLRGADHTARAFVHDGEEEVRHGCSAARRCCGGGGGNDDEVHHLDGASSAAMLDNPVSRANYLLSMPQFRRECDFTSTLIALSALHLTRAKQVLPFDI